MNFQNLNFEYVEQPRNYQQPHVSRVSRDSSSTSESQVTVIPYGRHSGEQVYASAQPASTSPQPTVVPHLPPPSTPSDSNPEIYGPDRVLGPPLVLTRNGVSGPRRESPLPIGDLHQIALRSALAGQMVTGLGFKDELALEAGKVTPGVDDSPYIQYALDALSRSRDTGYSQDASSSEDAGNLHPRLLPDRGLRYDEPRFRHSLPAEPAPAQVHEPGRDGSRRHSRPATASELQASPVSSLATLVRFNPTTKLPPIPPHAWLPLGSDDLTGDRAAANPQLSFRPPILQPLSLLTLMTLCVLMLAALIFCAVYSQARTGLWAYGGTIYSGRYFLLRILPPLLATIPLLFAQCIVTAMYRVMPFLRLGCHRPHEVFGALFEDLYPKTFLWPRLISPEVNKPTPGRRPAPRLQHTWRVWTPIIATWLMNFTLPLQSGLFTVIYVDGEWRWAAVQGVAWTLVALYLALLVSTASLLRYWTTRDRTGLLWDPRSIADVMALIAHSNTLEDYRGTELLSSRRELMLALPQRSLDNISYWTWLRDPGHETWYSIGTWGGGEEEWAKLAAALHFPASSKEEQGGMADLEAASPWEPSVRRRYLPWSLRTNQLIGFIATAFVLLLALFIVSFLPATSIERGFPPRLPAGPKRGAFSPADFLYSFLPSLLGLIMFLLFQSLDLSMRILQPWAELARQEGRYEGGAAASRSILADYASCYPIQVSWHALRNGHYRVAITSLLSTLFVLLPALSGGMFMALTDAAGVVLIYPNVPLYGIVLALLVLYLLALVALLPCRTHFRLPHGVTCLAEIISFCAAGAASDDAFRHVRDKHTLEQRLGADLDPEDQPLWVFGVGAGRDERLGIRRVRRYTEKDNTREEYGEVGGGTFSHHDDLFARRLARRIRNAHE